jgi:hypothetical protein
MSMDFEEFVDGIVGLTTLDPPRFPGEPFAKRLNRILLKLLGEGPRKFL